MGLVRPLNTSPRILIDEDSAGWRYLGFEIHWLEVGQIFSLESLGREMAIVPLRGDALVTSDQHSFELSRRDVFTDSGSAFYVAPNNQVHLEASTPFEFAIGSAPASGNLPTRLFTAAEVQVELRGGANALRQVHHVLAPPLPAERLISYEVYLPGGSWAGWPPHRHDGFAGSPYLEEIYYFRFERPDGYGFHRNYDDSGFDETFVVRDGDCVSVPKGYHVTTSSPGNNMWILNFLAGELIADERSRGPYFDPTTTWICDDWSKGHMTLPFDPAQGFSQ